MRSRIVNKKVEILTTTYLIAVIRFGNNRYIYSDGEAERVSKYRASVKIKIYSLYHVCRIAHNRKPPLPQPLS